MLGLLEAPPGSPLAPASACWPETSDRVGGEYGGSPSRLLRFLSRLAVFGWFSGCFGAFCLDVRTLTFCQLMGFSIKPLKVKLLAGEQKAAEVGFPCHPPKAQLFPQGIRAQPSGKESTSTGGPFWSAFH